MHPLTPKFRLPAALALGLGEKRCGYIINVAGDDMIFNHRIKPLAERPVQLHFGNRNTRKSRQYQNNRNQFYLHTNMISHSSALNKSHRSPARALVKGKEE